MSLIFFQNLHLWFLNSIVAKVANPDIIMFSMDKDVGCLGFLDPKIAWISFMYFGIFSSVMGSAGYVMCLLYYSPLVVSNAYLIEPLIAQLLSYFLNIDHFPSYITFIGGIFIIIGIRLIDQASRIKNNEKI